MARRGEASRNSNATESESESVSTASQPNQQEESPANTAAIQPEAATGTSSAGIGTRKGKKEGCPEELQTPIADLEKTLRSKTVDLTRQNRTRHQAVLKFLYYQRCRQDGETRQGVALSVAGCFNRGKWFAEQPVSWEISWRKNRTIPEGKQGCFQRIKSWLADEGAELAVREYLSGVGESKYGL